MKHIKKSKKGFTLVEIMVAIAIVGILSAVILVSMKSYGVKARSTRAIAQASSAIPSMISCAGNKGWSSINAPSNGGNICGSNSSYRIWPDMSLIDYSYSGISGSSVSSFYFTVTGDSLTICCNSTMGSCGIPTSGSCTAAAAW